MQIPFYPSFQCAQHCSDPEAVLNIFQKSLVKFNNFRCAQLKKKQNLFRIQCLFQDQPLLRIQLYWNNT